MFLVSVIRKNSYSGTFTIDQYDTEGHLLAHISGLEAHSGSPLIS